MSPWNRLLPSTKTKMETPGRRPEPIGIDGLNESILKEFPITSTQNRRKNNSGHQRSEERQ